jgi:hypothetical protein
MQAGGRRPPPEGAVVPAGREDDDDGARALRLSLGLRLLLREQQVPSSRAQLELTLYAASPTERHRHKRLKKASMMPESYVYYTEELWSIMHGTNVF